MTPIKSWLRMKMKYMLLTLVMLFPGWSQAEVPTGNHITIRAFKSGTNTLYDINGSRLERGKAIDKIKRIADFTTDCQVVIATTGNISLRTLHSFVKEVKAFGFSETHCLLIHEDQSFSIIDFTPSDAPELWRPIRCVCGGGCVNKTESQQNPGP